MSEPVTPSRRLRPRTVTLLLACAVVLLVGLAGATVPVPWVALGPGPTFNTLDSKDGTPVVSVEGLPTYPTSGHLNMTTVSVTDGLTMFQTLGVWVDPNEQVVPRNAVFAPGRTQEQIDAKNTQDFSDSESSAVSAALNYLKLPVRVFVGATPASLPTHPVLQPGDQIVAVAGHDITRIDEIRTALTGTTPGQQVPVRIVRGDAPQDVTVTLVALPGSTQGGLGIAPVAKPASSDDKITISLSGVGGPSAGLMFSLAVVDRLTPGELTGGSFIAGTGEIGATGDVGIISGIPLKLIAAKEAGAQTFLVPAGNCEEARANAPDGLTLVKVDGLADAVADLDTLRTGGTPPTC